MAAPLFSILHTSARPAKWREIYDAWMRAAVHPEDVEYVLCVDERWGFPALDERNFMEELALPHRVVWNNWRRCYVDGVAIAARASTGRVLIVNADDQYPCDEWDEKLSDYTKTIREFGIRQEKEWVIEVSTGTPDEHNRGMIVMPILSRERYERIGYVFYPRYESMYADNDFFEHAKQDGCILDARELLFPHRHPLFYDVPFDEAYAAYDVPFDEAYAVQNRKEAYELGEKVLAWRRRIQFGRKIDEAEKIPGWMTREELETISFWASQYNSIVEIGGYKGRSAYALGFGCSGKVTSIDSDPLFRDEFLKNTEGSRVWPHLDDSVKAASYWPDVDMVFVDGGHSYEQVKADLEAWTPKTRQFICGHDYADDAPGVVQAVREKFGDSVRAGPGRLWNVPLNGTASDAPMATQRPATARRSIAIALPGENFNGLWVAKLLETLFSLQKTWNFCTVINYTSSAGITRQTILQQIKKMEPDFIPEYILWIDDDQIVDAGIVDMLISDADQIPDADLVAGWTWIANSGAHENAPQVSCGRMDLDKGELSHAEYRSVQAANGVFEVHWTGFPVLVMRYSALGKLGKHPFAHYPCAESPWGECGEDISFCKRLRDAGGRIMVDSRAFVPHLKLRALGPAPLSEEEVKMALAGGGRELSVSSAR